MKKTILIPTDFSIESLIPVKHAALENQDCQLEIILMYCCFQSSSITELLFYSPEKIINEAISFEFREACLILENTYQSKISRLSIDVFHGLSGSAFDNFVAGNQITEAVVLKNYSYKLAKNGFDPMPYIRDSDLPYQEIDGPVHKVQHKDIILFNLFI